MNQKSFWHLPHCSKLGELREDRHGHIIQAALDDEDTKIERLDTNIYTIYGPEGEGLLIKPRTGATRCMLTMLEAIQAIR